MYSLIYLHQTSRNSMLSRETGMQLFLISGTYASCVGWSFFRSGGSINPAYAFAQNFWSEMKRLDDDSFKFIWIYTIFPFIGAMFAFLLHHLLVLPGNKEKSEKIKRKRIIQRKI